MRGVVRILVASLALFACAPPTAATPHPTAEPAEGEPSERPDELGPTQVRFRDRIVDLAPFLEKFPYTQFFVDLERGQMFFIELGDQHLLRSTEVGWALGLREGPPSSLVDQTAAKLVTEVDWSTRSLWSLRLQKSTGALWLHADANKDEHMNLWRIDMSQDVSQRQPEQITFAEHVDGWGFSEDQSQIAYLARSGTQAPYRTCLHVLAAKGEVADREVVCDSPELSFTRSSPRVSLDNERVYFAAQLDGDRNRVQIVEVILDARQPQARPITKTKVPRSSVEILEGWVDEEFLIYSSNEAGHGDIYSWSRRTRKSKRLTQHTGELLGAALVFRDAPMVAVAHRTPTGSVLELIGAWNGEVFGREEVLGRFSILDAHHDDTIWSRVAPDNVYEVNTTSCRRDSAGYKKGPRPKKRPGYSYRDSLDSGDFWVKTESVFRVPRTLEAQLIRCVPEAVKIPTVDGLQLDAYVLRPKEPLPEGQAIALVRSLEGGDYQWDQYDHILCAAGITVVSPVTPNDEVARWVEEQLGVPSSHIVTFDDVEGHVEGQERSVETWQARLDFIASATGG